MKQTAQPLERVRDIIRAVRAASPSPDNAKVIVNTVLSKHLDELAADDELVAALLRGAIGLQVRELLKNFGGDNAGPMRSRQLSMFPERLHVIVEQIDRERVFVPSRSEYVELVPDAMTTAEMREGGAYLVNMGEDCIRRGKALISLAAALEDDGA